MRVVVICWSCVRNCSEPGPRLGEACGRAAHVHASGSSAHDHLICKLSPLALQSACLLLSFLAQAPVRVSRATLNGNGEWTHLSFC